MYFVGKLLFLNGLRNSSCINDLYFLFRVMQHTLNEGVAGREIDVLLLDERFYRDTKPCHTRRDFCKYTDPRKTKYMWYSI